MKPFRLIEWLALLSMGMVTALSNGVYHTPAADYNLSRFELDLPLDQTSCSDLATRGEKQSNIAAENFLRNHKVDSSETLCAFVADLYEKRRIYGDIQKRLSPCTAVIEYRIHSNRLLTLLLTHDGAVVWGQRLGPHFFACLDHYQQLLQQRTLVKAKKQQRFWPQSFYLYRILIAPLENHIRGCRRLAIVAADNLSQLPFESLVSRYDENTTPANASWLLRRYSIQYQYSIDRLIANSSSLSWSCQFSGYAPMLDLKQNRIHLMPLSVAEEAKYRSGRNPAVSLRLSALQGSQKEVRGIVKAFRCKGLSARGYFGPLATKKRLQQHLQSRILHIATHGVYAAGSPSLGGLLFYPKAPETAQNILSAIDISQLNLECDLLVLACCRSGVKKGDVKRKKDSLARCFTRIGVPNVVCTVWNIGDRHSCSLMLEFYKAILAGKNYAFALRLAKLKLIERGYTALPCHWAPFLLLGNL